MTLPAVDSLIDQLAQALSPYFENSDSAPVLVGIQTGGVWVAQKLHDRLKPSTDLGELNISFYRDDFTRIGLHPTVKPSKLPADIDDQVIILVDDVLQSGRTIRAAMNEIFDYGRPRKILLAILIDRGAREIPIQADFTAATIELDKDSHIKLTGGPDNLTLEIKQLEANGD